MLETILAGLLLGGTALILAARRRPQPKPVPVQANRQNPRRR